uniref:Transmembrane protein 144 n=1 Tax=Parastrongyloides trichosuri TaxID=131310 RepID=A0A0N4ZR59_PARTI
MTLRCLKFPFLTILTGIVTIISGIIYGITMTLALEGFERQMNAFLDVGTLNFRFFIIISTIFFIIISTIFLTSSIFSTIKMNNYNSQQSKVISLFTSTFFTGPFIYLLYFTILFWAILFSITSICLGFYIVFITTTFFFCKLVDTQCFDFSVFLPIILEKITKKKVDLTFCSEKKERLCDRKNNMSWNFIISFICCLMSLMGLIHCLMILTNKWSRMRGKKKYFKIELKSKNNLEKKLIDE